MATDYSYVISREKELLATVSHIVPQNGDPDMFIRSIFALSIDKLRQVQEAYHKRSVDLSTQINLLKHTITTIANDEPASIITLVMLLMQLCRISQDHALHMQTQLRSIIEQAEIDVHGATLSNGFIESIFQLGDSILRDVPASHYMARCVAIDAITAITSYVSNCVNLVFGLSKAAIQRKEKSLEFLREDDQDSAKLVLLERQAFISTMEAMVKSSSIFVRAANWFVLEAQCESRMILCTNDLRMPCTVRTIDELKVDHERGQILKDCSASFAAFLDPCSTEHDVTLDKDWSFKVLSNYITTDSGYEALIKKVRGLVVDLREKKASLKESMLAGDIDTSKTLTAEIARQEEKISNLVAFGQDLHAELYLLPLGLNVLRDKLAKSLLILKDVLTDSPFPDKDQACSEQEASSPFLELVKKFAETEE